MFPKGTPATQHAGYIKYGKMTVTEFLKSVDPDNSEFGGFRAQVLTWRKLAAHNI